MGRCQLESSRCDPDGGRTLKQYLQLGLFPVDAPVDLTTNWSGSLPAGLWPKIMEQARTSSLRSLAQHYGVSYESIRRTLVAASTNGSMRNMATTGESTDY